MSHDTRIWRFSGLLRGLALIMAVLYGVYFTVTWASALWGDPDLAYEFVDLESVVPLEMWQIVCGFIFTGIAIAAMITIALAVSRFLKVSKQEGFFIVSAAKACRRMGYGLIAFWLGMLLTENFLPWVMTRNFPAGQQEEIEWFFLDANFIALLVGVVLILMSRAMDEARAIDADNKQFI